MSHHPERDSGEGHQLRWDADQMMTRREYMRFGLVASLGLAAAWLISPLTRREEEPPRKTSWKEAKYYRNLAG
ncbi:hypothetical protein AMJ39_09250 [candidate division TA06 bacterium DG_24]|uniref:Uncharacterized protein n=1 Tax=candidate division TA06 bacterium DG_24 TaxID=1703770 RepID=A0A0S7WNT0_UNCT6|nr:MAG: hypothetical protein AMJ39_09250 [candidate division TA06 bacterium DG_24]